MHNDNNPKEPREQIIAAIEGLARGKQEMRAHNRLLHRLRIWARLVKQSGDQWSIALVRQGQELYLSTQTILSKAAWDNIPEGRREFLLQCRDNPEQVS